jgi:hypothetical protein
VKALSLFAPGCFESFFSGRADGPLAAQLRKTQNRSWLFGHIAQDHVTLTPPDFLPYSEEQATGSGPEIIRVAEIQNDVFRGGICQEVQNVSLGLLDMLVFPVVQVDEGREDECAAFDFPLKKSG